MDTNKMRDDPPSLVKQSIESHPGYGEFAAWCESEQIHPYPIYFLIWQASREAVVVEMPEPYAVVGDYAACGGGRVVWDVEYAEKITDCMCQKTPVYDRASLESAGLKVSP